MGTLDPTICINRRPLSLNSSPAITVTPSENSQLTQTMIVTTVVSNVAKCQTLFHIPPCYTNTNAWQTAHETTPAGSRQHTPLTHMAVADREKADIEGQRQRAVGAVTSIMKDREEPGIDEDSSS